MLKIGTPRPEKGMFWKAAVLCANCEVAVAAAEAPVVASLFARPCAAEHNNRVSETFET